MNEKPAKTKRFGSRNKGKNYEREVGKCIADAMSGDGRTLRYFSDKHTDWHVRRSVQSGATHEPGDLYFKPEVKAVFPYCVECKREEHDWRIESLIERGAIPKAMKRWMDQVIRDCPKGEKPIVVFRKSKEESKVIAPLEFRVIIPCCIFTYRGQVWTIASFKTWIRRAKEYHAAK